MDERLRLLAKADVVAFGAVGIAGTMLPVTEAFHALVADADRHADALRPALERLLATATPAGKVYAAALLDLVDAAAGRDAWLRLAGDRSPVQTFQGCVAGRTTVAEYAANRQHAG